MKTNNFTYLVKQGVVSVWYNRMMSIASFCILMVSLLLITLATLIMADVGVVIGNIEQKNEILVYVTGEATQGEISHITDVLQTNSYVDSVVFYSKEEAWADQKEKMPEYEKLFEYWDQNPMPNTFRVTINDLTKIDSAVAQIETVEGVESISAPYDFASFLVSMRTTFTAIGTAVLVALIIVSLVIVYNSTRSSVFSRRVEISIMKYVGATNSFIRIPFFIEGIFIGILSGVASWLLSMVAYNSLVSLFAGDLTIWQVLGMVDIIDFGSISWIVLLANCFAGAFLSATGTILSMGKHLRV